MSESKSKDKSLSSARLSPLDLLRLGASGLRTRPLRLVLSALGIAIGIGAMVSVLGISASSKAAVNARLDELGTNLLTVSPGRTFVGDEARLPKESLAMVARLPEVEEVSATASVDARVYRTDHIPEAESKGISVRAARIDLLDVVAGTVASGTWLNDATSQYPAVVLGDTAARRLGIVEAAPRTRVWLGEEWFTVIGILDPVELLPELDTSALVGWEVAQERLDFDGHPTTVFERSADEAVERLQGLLAAAANPENPHEVDVSRPSEVLAARAAIDTTLTGLLLGLAGVALLVGGIGVANTMVISVLERRSEIGLRRALGATRGQIRGQFLLESLLLSAIGAFSGVALGVVVTVVYARSQDWVVAIHAGVLGAALGATVTIGTLAGLYPAIRAARLDPTTALATT